MDLNYSPAEIAFRDQVRAWLRAHLPDDLPEKVVNYRELERNDYVRWHKILAQKGWVAPEWPVEWGGTNWTVVQRYIASPLALPCARPCCSALPRVGEFDR